MTRAEILAEYSITEQGVIETLGKFENEMLYVPHLWDAVLNGAEEETADDGAVRILIEPDDVAEFPELQGFVQAWLWESESGFVYCTVDNGRGSRFA
jgi:hypothetical protein